MIKLDGQAQEKEIANLKEQISRYNLEENLKKVQIKHKRNNYMKCK